MCVTHSRALFIPGAEHRRAGRDCPELRAAQPEVDSTSRRKKVGNLPAPKS